jgi:3-phenylpropionate/trans-cinnamate dioxygenase ferredoxin component
MTENYFIPKGTLKIDPEKFQFYAIPDVKSLQNGERMFIDIDGQPIVIFNIAGNYFAIGDECTHDEGSLGEGQLEGYIVTCPRHGACYDIRTGEAISLPAVISTPAYPIRSREGNIEIGLPR